MYSFLLPVYSFWCMDDFGWGNTRLVIGEGNSKKVIMNEDEKFDDSMIPLKKFSGKIILAGCLNLADVRPEYEAEAWETGSHRSGETGYTKARSRAPASRPESPRSYMHASQSGDFYRDTNAMQSNKDLRSQVSHSNLSHHGGQQAMSQYGGGMPQLPFMPFGTGYAGSANGSEYGGQMPMAMAMPYQHSGSVYGMVPNGPRNTMMTNYNMFGGGMGMGGMSPAPSVTGVAPVGPSMGMQQRPMSTFSMATSVNPFAGPSMSTDPSDEELTQALRNYLSTQDLMTVTKK